jgi:hypothetical protein
MASKLLFTLALSTVVVASGGAASAQPSGYAPTAAERETARGLMEAGDDKLAAGDLRGALEAYRSADEIMNVPTTALAVGRALARLGKLVSAVDALGRARRHPSSPKEPAAFRKAREAAAKLDAELARRIPTVTVEVSGPSPETPVTVAVDGSALTGAAAEQPRRVDPGRRVVEVRAPGYHTVRRELELAEQEHETLAVTLEVDPDAALAPEPSPGADGPGRSGPGSTSTELSADESADSFPLTVATWAGFSLGGAGLLVGTITGAVVLGRTSDLEARCGGTSCPPDEQGAHDTTVTLANVSNAGFVVGAIGLAVGTTALILDLTRSDEAPNQAFQPVVGPGFLGLKGRF